MQNDERKKDLESCFVVLFKIWKEQDEKKARRQSADALND